MSILRRLIQQRLAAMWEAWNQFWFEPRDPATLGLIRILAGGMLFYTHLVWSVDLLGFLGPNARIPVDHIRLLFSSPRFPDGNPFAWSHLFFIDSPAALWMVHIAALLVLALFTLGVATRLTSVLSFLITVSYSHRLAAAQFGLDQINAMLAMYLMIGASGDAFSVDRWWRKRRYGDVGAAEPTVSTCVATRLMQIHLCVIYFFAGAGKLLGGSWWSGTAMWGAIANQEYQTMDLTWLAAHPLWINVLTHLTVAWELSYAFLIWRPSLRPWILLGAVPIHLGIGVCMGMGTFGLVMLIANAAFISPEIVRRALDGRKRAETTPRTPRPASPGRAVAKG